MSAGEVAGLFGLGGVALGGGMTMLSARWQSASAHRCRFAELELQLKHERLLRDETAKRTAILELIAALERFLRAVNAVAWTHAHRDALRPSDPAPECELSDMKDVVAAGGHCYDLLLKNRALIGNPRRLYKVVDMWESIRFGVEPFKAYYYDAGEVYPNEYCTTGGQVACLAIPISDGIIDLDKELKALDSQA
jgi:hypothetical protein